MFSGKSGTVVESDIKDDAAVAKMPTNTACSLGNAWVPLHTARLRINRRSAVHDVHDCGGCFAGMGAWRPQITYHLEM